MKINKIYTRTGDDGTTGLVRGPRRPKFDIRINAYGTVEEANSCLGLARIQSANLPIVDAILARVQNDLFDVGSDLATPGLDESDAGAPTLRVRPVQTRYLEAMIDTMNERLTPLRSFVLPGGSELSAALHLARTTVRRAERILAELMWQDGETNPETLRYLNRLSDLLFVLGRIGNDDGRADVTWVPGLNSDLEAPVS